MSINLSFFGDFVATDAEEITLSNNLRELLEQSDLNVVNFEAPVDGGYAAFEREGPRLKQPVSSRDFLISHGFNVFQLANNHMCDYGEDGCRATVEAFKNVTSVGAGTVEEAYGLKVKEVKGMRIGFLAFVHHEFGVLDGFDKNQKYGTAWINSPRVDHAIIDAKEKVDYLIVLPHAGVELVDIPLPEWRERYKDFINFGADAVIGTHPHVPQGWECYNGKPIFYSLGNFYFDAIMPSDEWWYKGLAVTLMLGGEGISYTVQNTMFKKGHIDVDYSKETKLHNKEIAQFFCDDEVYIKRVNEMARMKWTELNLYYIRGLGAASFRLSFMDFLKSVYCMLFRKPSTSLFVNALQCESHRYVALRVKRLEMNNNQ